jgi:Dynamin family
MATAQAKPLAEPVHAVDLALGALVRYGRPDLEARLRQAKDRLVTDQVRVLVVGEFKKGKSMLVNGIVGAPACPVLDDLATAVPTMVRYAETPGVTLVRHLDTGATQRTPVPLDHLTRYATESGNPANRERLAQVEVCLPNALLGGGLVFVDTPGVGGLCSAHAAATMSMLPAAEAVLLVSDASGEYTAPEIEFLRQARTACPNVACVMTKTDLYPQWRQIAELNREHLKQAGIQAPLFCVSSALRWQAVTTRDEALRAELNTESGYPDLVRYLRADVLAKADLLARRCTVNDVLAVTEQVAAGLRAERAAQQDPERAQEVIRELTAAEQRANELKERSARWQQTLNDGIADLNADIDYDLRDRLREILHEAERAVEAGDPTKTWEQFAGWVEQSVANAVSANYVWATQRARWLAGRVAEHFDEQREHLLPSPRVEAADPMGGVRALTLGEAEPLSLGRRLFTGMRGGYMGMVMFGMLGSLAGFALLNPLTVGAAVLLSRRALVDEKKRVVTKRRSDAKAALRRYIDEVTFRVSKHSRDRLRGVQRTLRDYFTTQAEEMKRSLQETQRAAEKSVKASKAERDARLTEINAELSKLDSVTKQIRSLMPAR